MSIDPIEWQAPTEDLSLKAGEIHVWLIHSPAENYLDTAEQARADKLVSPIHQKRFIAAHSGLREILGLYTKQSPREVVFAQTDSGKPFLKKFPEIHFNLSHSEDIALCAISNHPVGIDIEYLNKDIKFLELAKRFFSQSEYEFLKLQNNKNLNLEFLKLWTQKEAYLKSQGKKISSGLEIEIPEDFAIYHFEPIPHTIAAVGGEGKTSLFPKSSWDRVSFFSFTELLK